MDTAEAIQQPPTSSTQDADVSPSAARMRKARSRRKDGVRVEPIEVHDAHIEILTKAGLLDPGRRLADALGAMICELATKYLTLAIDPTASGLSEPNVPVEAPQAPIEQQASPTPAAEIARSVWRAAYATLESHMAAAELRELIAHSAKQYRTPLIQALMIEITPDQYDGLSADVRRHFMPIRAQ